MQKLVDNCIGCRPVRVCGISPASMRYHVFVIAPTLFSCVPVNTAKSINHSWGAYAGGRVASPTLRRHSWRSRLESPHAGSLPIPSNSQQEASTCRSQEFCGRPLGLLQVGLSLAEATRQAGSASGYRALCPYSRSWRWRTMLVIGLESVSWNFQKTQIITKLIPTRLTYLTSHIVQKAPVFTMGTGVYVPWMAAFICLPHKENGQMFTHRLG